MMCIHAYFNIWCEARAGWGVFMKRRTAVHKISSLPEATPQQLRTFDDVCAICYQVSPSSDAVTKFYLPIGKVVQTTQNQCTIQFSTRMG